MFVAASDGMYIMNDDPLAKRKKMVVMVMMVKMVMRRVEVCARVRIKRKSTQVCGI